MYLTLRGGERHAQRYTTTSAHLEISPNLPRLACIPAWGLAVVREEDLGCTERPQVDKMLLIVSLFIIFTNHVWGITS